MQIEKYYELLEDNNDSRLIICLENIDDIAMALSDVVIIRNKNEKPNTSRGYLDKYIYSLLGEEAKNMEVYAYNVIKSEKMIITKYLVSYEDNGLGIKTNMFIDAMIKRFGLVLTGVTLEERFAETIEKIADQGAYLLLNTDNFEVRSAKAKEGYKLTDDEGRFIITYDEEDKAMVRSRIKN